MLRLNHVTLEHSSVKYRRGFKVEIETQTADLEAARISTYMLKLVIDEQAKEQVYEWADEQDDEQDVGGVVQ
jgi:hypothetical protein